MGRMTVWQGLLFLQVVAFCVANSPPSLSEKVVSRVIAKLGKNTRLACPAEADHELTQWKKDGQSISPALERFKVSRDGQLRIKNTEMDDAGFYTCIATNGFGSITINYTVIVLDEERKVFREADREYEQSPNEDLRKEASAPFFEDLEKMRESADTIKPTGSTIRLLCRVDGNPIPEVYWYKNGRRRPHRRSHHTLRINDATAEDGGTYMCNATNRLGHINFTYHVQVIDEIRHKPRLIAPHPLNQTVDVGATVSFQCFIESVVKPEVQWLKRVDRPEDIPNPNITLVKHNEEKFIVLKNAGILNDHYEESYLNKLVIQNVQPKDAGLYVCFATNRRGYTTRHAYLNVRLDGTGSYYPRGEHPSGRDGLSHNVDVHLSGDLPSSISQDTSSDNSDNDSTLPLLIGLPSCAVLILILLTVFLMQRNNRCQRSTASGKVPRPPVPPHERDAFYYSNCQQQQQTVNPLLNSRDKLPPKTPTPSVDMTCSEFSSVSRTHPNPHFYHPQQHHHMNYGY